MSGRDGEQPVPSSSDIGPAPTVDPTALRAKAKVAHALFGEPTPESVPYTRVDRYEIDSRLGAGAMGVVYQAWDPQLERPIAIKVLHNEVATDHKARLRLTREAKSLARLSHPNVIQVYDVGTDADRVFVAMELVDGETLSQWLAKESRAWPRIVEVLTDAGRGLQAAHQAGLVHRDLKPDNILIGRDGRVRVLDFGLARFGEAAPSVGAAVADNSGGERSPAQRREAAAQAHHTTLTETGTVVGTPLYMAPEQLLDGRAASASSDQYSFCVTFYEALYQQRPFAGTTLPGIVANVSVGNIREPPVSSDVPRPVFASIRRGLAKDPDERWPSISELLTEIADTVRKSARSASSRRRTWAWAIAVALALTGIGTFVAFKLAASS